MVHSSLAEPVALVGLALPFGVAGPKGEVFDRQSFARATFEDAALCGHDHGRHALARYGATLATWCEDAGLYFVARLEGLTAPIYQALAERPGRLGASIGGSILSCGGRGYVHRVKDVALLQHGATGRHGSYAPAFKETWVRPIASVAEPMRKRAERELLALAKPAASGLVYVAGGRRAPMPSGTRPPQHMIDRVRRAQLAHLGVHPDVAAQFMGTRGLCGRPFA
ncbi:MAG: hypothetical protein KF815_01295 [Rhodospirillales bacterium]|nr:hypothetical protein [Rhodospirillales bacterium]